MNYVLYYRAEASARYEIYEQNNNYPPLNNYNENRPIGPRPFQPGPNPLPVQR